MVPLSNRYLSLIGNWGTEAIPLSSHNLYFDRKSGTVPFSKHTHILRGN